VPQPRETRDDGSPAGEQGCQGLSTDEADQGQSEVGPNALRSHGARRLALLARPLMDHGVPDVPPLRADDHAQAAVARGRVLPSLHRAQPGRGHAVRIERTGRNDRQLPAYRERGRSFVNRDVDWRPCCARRRSRAAAATGASATPQTVPAIVSDG